LADVKISGLPASTVPLAGTEVLPIVQGGTTKQVSIANLTAGRAVSAASLALTTTPLPVTSGGSGTATAFTAGSVVFAGASGLYSQDNANLFWDDTNNRLGIGTATPSVSEHIYTAQNATNVELIRLQNNGTGTNVGTTIAFWTTAELARLQNGYDGSVFFTELGDKNGVIKFTTGASYTEKMRIHNSGGVSIGNTTDPGATNLSVNGVIKIGANQAVNGPAFSAGLAPNNQSVNASTATKITIDTEDFDTNSNYDPTTNYRFTPTVGGYYQISAGITTNAAASGTVQVFIYKNGTLYKAGTQVLLGAATATTVTVSCLVNMNGSSDYVELFCFQSSAAALLVFTNSTAATWFQGSMVRGL